MPNPNAVLTILSEREEPLAHLQGHGAGSPEWVLPQIDHVLRLGCVQDWRSAGIAGALLPGPNWDGPLWTLLASSDTCPEDPTVWRYTVAPPQPERGLPWLVGVAYGTHPVTWMPWTRQPLWETYTDGDAVEIARLVADYTD